MKGSRLPTGRELAKDEVDALYRVCREDRSPKGLRDAAIVAVLYSTGLRRAELVSINIEDFNGQNRSLRVIGKGNKERQVFLSETAVEAVQRYQEIRQGEGGEPLFVRIRKGGKLVATRLTEQAIYSILKTRGDEAATASFSPHDFRRTLILPAHSI